MKQKKDVEEQIIRIRELDISNDNLGKKLEELMTLLEHSDIDSDSLSAIQAKFNKAIDNKKTLSRDVQRFQEINVSGMSRLELANDLEAMLSKSNLNSENVKEIAPATRRGSFIVVLIGIVMITLGFAMIVMPAPPYFEMFTIFYFNTDDGVTLMDLVSLLIVLCGVYLVFTSSIRRSKA